VFFQNDNINTLDEDSEFRLTIMAGVAQDEVRKLSSRIKFGHKQAIKNGVVLGNSHLYGYNKEKGRLSVNEDEAKMVRYIFESYAGGIMTTPKIEKALFEKGYRNYKGGKIDRGVIQHIITNPKYKGYYVGNKVKIVDMFTKKQKFLPEEEWVMYRDDEGERVPAIVSEELWEEANRIYKMRGDIIKDRRSSFKTDNLFTGKIICEADGSPYWLKARIDRKGNNNSTWVCSHKLKEGTASCPSFSIMERELLDILVNVLQDISGNFDDIVERFIELYQRTNQAADYSKEIKSINKEIEKIHQKKDKLLEYNLDGKIADSEFLRRNDTLNEELIKLEAEISALEKQQQKDDLKLEDILRLKNNLKGFEQIRPEDLTQNVINLLIDKIYAEPVDERSMSLKIVLNTGESHRRLYEKVRKSGDFSSVRSGHTFKKMIEAQEQQMAGNTGTTSR
ncbi:MAG: recombinase family protein, partial [Firmicutes bacterium]|nr:recombinase family protein [Bacillota bacterium]